MGVLPPGSNLAGRMRSIWLKVVRRTVVEFFRAPNVAVTEMVKTDRYLNQALEKGAIRPRVILPKLFPFIVCFKKIAVVEIANAFEIKRVVICLFHIVSLQKKPGQLNS